MTDDLIAVSLYLLIGIVGAAWHRRRSADRSNGVFPCRVRPAGPRDGVHLRSWRKAKAHWDGDNLVAEAGPLRRSRRVLHVRSAHHILDLRVTPSARSTASIHLDLVDGSSVEVSTKRDHLDSLAGPFLIAHPALAQDRIDRKR
jgi:hypothetical protein